jgi:hypothetical protein
MPPRRADAVNRGESRRRPVVGRPFEVAGSRPEASRLGASHDAAVVVTPPRAATRPVRILGVVLGLVILAVRMINW